MPKRLGQKDRTAIINQLVGNEGCCAEEDREFLAGMSDNSLLSLYDGIANRAVVNAVADVLGAPQGITANQLVEFITTNAEEGEVPKGEDSDEWDDEDDNLDGPETDEDEPSDDKKGKGGSMKMNRRMSMSEWMRIAPPEVRSAVTNARKIELQEKGRLIEGIVANLDGEQRERTINLLRTKSNDELEVLANLAPRAPSYQPDLWTGAAAPIGNAQGKTAEPMEDVSEEFAVSNSNGRSRKTRPMDDDE